MQALEEDAPYMSLQNGNVGTETNPARKKPAQSTPSNAGGSKLTNAI